MSQAGSLNLGTGGAPIETITGDDGIPIVPVSGNVDLLGAVVANSTNAKAVYVKSTAADADTIQVQVGAAIAATDVTKVGLVALNSNEFSVDANGFVSSNDITLTNGVNLVFSAGTTNLGSSISARSDILTYIDPGAYPYTVLSTDYFVSVDSASSRTINLPNAPTAGKSYVIKDRTGNAAANNITITTPGGVVTIDGATSRTIASNYGSVNVVFNGTNYEVW